jgi:hypothetical protein
MLRIIITIIGFFLAVALFGCVRVGVGVEGGAYYKPNPHQQVFADKDGIATRTVAALHE